jgi:hypothetical protein
MNKEYSFKTPNGEFTITLEECYKLLERIENYSLDMSDFFRLDSIFKALKTQTNMDELIRNPLKPDWEINDILVTRVKWTAKGEGYKRVEHRELIQRNLSRFHKSIKGIISIIENK